MSEEWDYQIRLYLDDARAELGRRDAADPALAPLGDILARHNATLKCQYDAFADYCAEAEREGRQDDTLYKWTKDVIADPAKKAKYLKSFTLYVDGDETYARDKAEALENDLQPLVEDKLIVRLTKHDTNPANNPQAPARYRS